jgi:hypothetical protein
MGLSSFTSISPFGWAEESTGQAYNGRRWLVLFAEGGWAPVSFCDPRVGNYPDKGPKSNYSEAFIKNIGPFNYVPAITPDALAKGLNAWEVFLNNHHSSLLQINGVNMTAAGHGEAAAAALSGNKIFSYPCTLALIARVANDSRPNSQYPFPFLSDDRVFSDSKGLVSTAGPNALGAIDYMTHPDSAYQDKRSLMDSGMYDNLKQLQKNRIENYMQTASLMAQRKKLEEYMSQFDSNETLKRLKEKLPTVLENNSTKQRIQRVFAAMAADLTVGAQIRIEHSGGANFDSHGAHDATHGMALHQYWDIASFAVAEAERQGIRNNLNILFLSDVGRTPFYNTAAGTDHWSVSSMFFMGPDFTGNRVIQASDDNMGAVKLNLETLEPDPLGAQISAPMIASTLREMASPNNQLSDKFRLNEPAVTKLFTG